MILTKNAATTFLLLIGVALIGAAIADLMRAEQAAKLMKMVEARIEKADPAEHQIWAVLDQARRITQEAAEAADGTDTG